MKVGSVVFLLIALSSAVEYGSLQTAIHGSSVQTLRLSEIQAKVESKGPIDQLGQLCYQQLREIMTEVEELDSQHLAFSTLCSETMIKYSGNIYKHSQNVATQSKISSKQYVAWNKLRPELPPIRARRERMLALIHKMEAMLKKDYATRAAKKLIYDRDMVDFAQALKDIDGIKKIISNSNLSNKQTSSNVAKQGFLEVVDSAKSDIVRQMTHRLSLAASFLEEENASGPSGTDKIMNLIHSIRNEMWAEMDKLTKTETQSIQNFKTHVERQRNRINALHLGRARFYIKMGHILSFIGKKMMQEADANIESAEETKLVDQNTIEKRFTQDRCSAEPPQYSKSRSIKISEIETISKMLKIIKGLNWKGPVFNAISRIKAAGVDENPEAGYILKFQMNVNSGMAKNRYAIQDLAVKNFGRVAIKLQLGSTWVWTSFDAFSADFRDYLVPDSAHARVAQRYIKNLVVKKSPSAKVKDGSSAQGNVEMWLSLAGKENKKEIPSAEDGVFDWGDERLSTNKIYGCFQVHDYLNKQTVLAVNNFHADTHDVGIGNQPVDLDRERVEPDWTYASNSKKYKEEVVISWYFQFSTVAPAVPTTKSVTKPTTTKATASFSPTTKPAVPTTKPAT